MLRRSLLAVPAVAALAAVLGSTLDTIWAVGLGAAAGLVVALALARVGDRRAGAVADRVELLAAGGTDTGIAPQGSRQWQRMLRALNAVGTSLSQRFDELAGERARVERLLDNLAPGVLLFTGEGLAYANPSAQELFGCRRAEARLPRDVLGVEGLADAVAEAQETGRTVEVEDTRGDRLLVGRASVITPGEVALIVTDLTEARRVEAMRRDFVINASHELKTPVAGIQALAESLSLAAERDPQRARTMIRRLEQEAARLGTLVRDLLDLARLEEGSQRPTRSRVDLATVLAVQCRRLDRLAEDRGVTVVCDCPEPASVIALPEDLRLIVANLLENAVQYNRRGGAVRASVRRKGSEVVLEVADTGIGIPEADRDRIFERFYRVDKARSRLAGGTGLGLSLVRNAVQRCGGHLSVHSIPGEGSTFRVVLPVEGEAGG